MREFAASARPEDNGYDQVHWPQGRNRNCDRTLAGIQQAGAQAPTLAVDPSRLPRLGTIDVRFQSYNVEMVEVTGGRFWKPYGASGPASSDRGADTAGNIPAGGNPDLFAYRKSIDLSNPRLRILAAALAPAYMRVSGTWANSTYFAESDETPATPPSGFSAVLSRERWKGVIDFARAASAEIVTSMATSAGARDAAGHGRAIRRVACSLIAKPLAEELPPPSS